MFPEADVRKLMYMTLQGVYHIHSNGFMHRDLKLANLLLSSDLSLRVIDFGLACKVPQNPNPSKKEIVGSLRFMAPEIFTHHGAETIWTPKVDMWALGVIMFFMLAGQCPFYGEDDEEVENAIVNDQVFFSINPRLKNCSDDAIDLMSKLLEKKPLLRLSAEEALQHPFFSSVREEGKPKVELEAEILRNIIQYKDDNFFKKAALNIFVKNSMAQDDGIGSSIIRDADKLRKQFEALDLDQSGLISTSEFTKALKDLNIGLE